MAGTRKKEISGVSPHNFRAESSSNLHLACDVSMGKPWHTLWQYSPVKEPMVAIGHTRRLSGNEEGQSFELEYEPLPCLRVGVVGLWQKGERVRALESKCG